MILASQMRNCIFTGEEAVELKNIKLAEDAPEPIEGGLVRAERGRVLQEEAEVDEFRSKPSEDRLQRLLVVGDIFVLLALVVVQLADLAELKTIVALLLLHQLYSDYIW